MFYFLEQKSEKFMCVPWLFLFLYIEKKVPTICLELC